MTGSLLRIVIYATILAVGCCQSATVTLNNNCNETIWPAYYGVATDPSSGAFAVIAAGWEAPSKTTKSTQLTLQYTVLVQAWARQVCDFSNPNPFETCKTGSCTGGLNCTGAPLSATITIAEFMVQGGDKGITYYVNLDSGFNLPVEITGGSSSCPSTSCLTDFRTGCPSTLQTNDNGVTLGCGPGGINSTVNSWYQQGCPDAQDFDKQPKSVQCTDLSPSIQLTFCPDNVVAAPPLGGGSTNPSQTAGGDSSNAPQQTSPTKHGLSQTALIGIIVGVVGGALLIALALLGWLLKRWFRQRTSKPPKLNHEDSALVINKLASSSNLSPSTTPNQMSTPSRIQSPNPTVSDTVSLIAPSARAARTPFDWMDASTLVPRLVHPNHPDFDGMSRTTLAPASAYPFTRPGTVDLAPLVEDREMEGEVHHFVSRRMDHPRPQSPDRLFIGGGEDEAPPNYQESKLG